MTTEVESWTRTSDMRLMMRVGISGWVGERESPTEPLGDPSVSAIPSGAAVSKMPELSTWGRRMWKSEGGRQRSWQANQTINHQIGVHPR